MPLAQRKISVSFYKTNRNRSIEKKEIVKNQTWLNDKLQTFNIRFIIKILLMLKKTAPKKVHKKREINRRKTGGKLRVRKKNSKIFSGKFFGMF